MVGIANCGSLPPLRSKTPLDQSARVPCSTRVPRSLRSLLLLPRSTGHPAGLIRHRPGSHPSQATSRAYGTSLELIRRTPPPVELGKGTGYPLQRGKRRRERSDRGTRAEAGTPWPWLAPSMQVSSQAPDDSPDNVKHNT
jgi:hypothetical protein